MSNLIKKIINKEHFIIEKIENISQVNKICNIQKWCWINFKNRNFDIRNVFQLECSVLIQCYCSVQIIYILLDLSKNLIFGYCLRIKQQKLLNSISA